jgi:hypothetical protein
VSATEPVSEVAARPASEGAPNDEKRDWGVAKPATIPRPTYSPAALAFGLTFFLWGLIASPVVLVVGLLVTAVALASWIGEMRDGE